ncbi:MAG: TonB-dependent receptor [Phascolarctobacterium sp.]|nr:TonB-dependent receptor [Phascolarctobacterium sp.]
MQKTKKSLLLATLLCGTALFSSANAQAQELVGEFDLDTMVVTATRIAEDQMKIPAVVHVIGEKEIAEKNVLTITDALKTVPGIYDGRAGGMSDTANSIQMRGFGEADILVLYDGMPLNDGYSGKVNWSAIAIDDVARIEVVQGAASSLYGGHAVGGVINIISKDPDKDSAKVYMHYGSDSTWKRGVSVSKKLGQKLSVGFSYENKETDGHKKKLIYKAASKETSTPKGEIGTGAVSDLKNDGSKIYLLGYPGGGHSEDDTYNFKLKYKFDDNKSLSYKYTHDKYKYFAVDPVSYIHDENGNPMYSGSVLLPNGKYLTFSESDFTDYDGRRDVDKHALAYKDDKNKITLNLGVTNVKDYGYATGSDLAGEGKGSDAKYPSKAYKADFQKVWEGKHTVVAGFNLQKDSMDYTKSSLSKWSDKNSITSINSKMGGTNFISALFVQDQYQFSDAYSVTAGLRLDHYQKKDGYFTNATSHIDQKDEKYTELSPKIAFQYTPDDDTTYYVSYGHSFNAPNLYQLYRHDPNYGYVANPDLKPETTDTFEVGLKKNLSDKAYMGIALYSAKTTDLINAVTRSDGKKWYVNIAEAKRLGAEFDLNFKHDDNFSSYLNYTQQYAKDEDGDRITSIPKRIMNAGVRYSQEKWSAYLEGTYVSDRLSKGNIGGRLYSEDGFFTANIGVNYKFMKNGTLSASVNNLFDRDYWQWYKSAGRTWNVGVEFAF